MHKSDIQKLGMQHIGFIVTVSEIEMAQINVSYLTHCPSESTLIYWTDSQNKTLLSKEHLEKGIDLRIWFGSGSSCCTAAFESSHIKIKFVLEMFFPSLKTCL